MIPALMPCLAYCLDCDGARALTVRGCCETCGSSSVMREPDTARLFRRDRMTRPVLWPAGLYRPEKWGRA